MEQYKYTAKLILDTYILEQEKIIANPELIKTISFLIQLFGDSRSEEGINDTTFPMQSKLFLLADMHLIYARRLETGEIILEDPAKVEQSHYPTVNQFLLSKDSYLPYHPNLEGFSGISFLFFKSNNIVLEPAFRSKLGNSHIWFIINKI
jgi:hypothetical protein